MQKLGVIEPGVWVDRNAARTGSRVSFEKREKNLLGKAKYKGEEAIGQSYALHLSKGEDGLGLVGE